ncbi:MAG: hypothetical protein ABI644_13055 [Arenimonas sp.]
MSAFTIPLYREINNDPQLFGSGFFVKYENQYFLISAAHVLEILRQEPLTYFVTKNERVALSGQVYVTQWSGDRENDPTDIAVLRFNGDATPPYPDVNKFSMDFSYLKSSLLPRSNKHYAMIGYPASKSHIDRPKREVTSDIFAYAASSIPDDDYKTHGYAIETHLILPLDLKIGYDANGTHRNFPKPQGMSGSPIWVHFDEDKSFSDERVFPVVAIGTKYLNGIGIIATDISFAIDLIKKASNSQ